MSIERTYTGRGGQRVFVGELLFRNCNAAIPEVDQGMDVFAFLDLYEEIARIQVKTGQAARYKKEDGYSTQFAISHKQLTTRNFPPLFYALLVRLDNAIIDTLIISRAHLQDLWNGDTPFGTKAGDSIVLTVQIRKQILCGTTDLTLYRNAWHLLPPLQPAAREGSAVSSETAGGLS